MSTIVEKYRAAARKLWPEVTEADACEAIVTPEDDTGDWSPGARAIIYLEYGRLPLNYWETYGHENCFKLADETGTETFIEYINAAVAAVHDA